MMPNMMVDIDKPTIISLDSFNKSISENMEGLQALLKSNEDGGVRADRLQVVKLITLLVQCHSSDINRELVRLKTLDLVWELFIQHSFNNFLHTQVVPIIEFILNTKVSSPEDAILLNYVIKDLALMRRVEEVWEENNTPGQKSEMSRKRRVGYLGHVYKIAVTIQDIVSGKENKKYFLEWLETQHDPNFWNTFYEETLKEQRDKNNTDLGPDPRRYNHMDSDDDNEDKIGIGLKNLVNNPLFNWKPDEEEDLEFSFEPAESNNFSQMEYKPVVVPEWKDKKLDEYWEKKITFSEPEQTSSMQVQEDSSSSEEEDVKEVSHDPWASTPQQEFSKMDTDVSWANFNDFEPNSSSSETREKPWESTPPDGSVLHSSPKATDKKTKYDAPGTQYTVEDLSCNGTLSEGVLDKEMIDDASSPPATGTGSGGGTGIGGPMITESPTTWPTAEITS